MNHVYLGLGSNLGGKRRIEFIEKALFLLKKRIGPLKNSSCLYQSKPIGIVENSRPENFLNCAVLLETQLEPQIALNEIKKIERDLGRNSVVQVINGERIYSSRTIDIDILMWNDNVIDLTDTSGRHLTVPHPRLQHRDFVLQPLFDINPGLVHPLLKKNVSEMCSAVGELSASFPNRMFPIADNLLPLGSPRQSNYSLPLNTNLPFETQVMGILNITPDSFSDGCSNYLCPNEIERRVQNLIMKKVDIIDIGGESTRPGSKIPPVEEELERVCNAVRIAKKVAGPSVCISIDTRRAKVAKEALSLGAHLINDVSGGEFDSEMMEVVTNHQDEEGRCASMCIMHMRGTTDTMNALTDYEEEGGVINTVSSYLKKRIDDFTKNGLPRWRIIADPGLGFAKNTIQNIQLVANMDKWASSLTTPVLIGHSRKRFIRDIIGENGPYKPSSMSAYAGSVLAAEVSAIGGAEIIRVHDVAETKSALRMSQEIRKAKNTNSI
eukprot:GDKJ01018425.1.p1 GENE.GDKJ01018425.1~~GDKJ01018425.1.p1  ORF type:complete len:504 (+),score=70.28 GDKJ01018425.1:30-1514(+)